MTKHRPVLQLVILSVHLITSKGQGEFEISTYNVSVPCQNHLSNRSKDLSNLCQNLGAQVHDLCSVEEVRRLCKESPSSVDVSDRTTPDAISVAFEATGHDRLLLQQEVVDGLSDRCKRTMAASVKELTSQDDGGCDYLESIRNQLLDSRICLMDDYENLHGLMCRIHHEDAAKLADDVKLRNSFMSTLNNDVSRSCHDALLPEVAQLTDDLSVGCHKLMNLRSRLVADGSCTDLDLTKLTKKLCGEGQPVSDDVHRVLHNDITAKCQVAMTSGPTDILGKTVVESCDSLKSFKDLLLIGDFCTADDYQKLYDVTCGKANVMLMNYLLSLVCLLITVLFQT